MDERGRKRVGVERETDGWRANKRGWEREKERGRETEKERGRERGGRRDRESERGQRK